VVTATARPFICGRIQDEVRIEAGSPVSVPVTPGIATRATRESVHDPSIVPASG
jgi:hypothetical protein